MSRELIDAATREHLVKRFGPWVIGWCEELPALVEDLTQKWRFRVGVPVSRGRNSCVLLCELEDGERAMLKLTPDRSLGVAEAAALAAWRDSGRVPQVFELDDESGTLLMEAIHPGTVLADDSSGIRLSEVVGLVLDLRHSADDQAKNEFPPLIERVEFIFAFLGGLLETMEVAAVVPPDLVEESLVKARKLAVKPGPQVLLHGDLHPGNVLVGGDRGFVAIDPRPCIGDPAFDLIDWVFFGRGDVSTLVRRAERLAGEAVVDTGSLVGWCQCTAVLVAIARLLRGENSEDVHPLLEFAGGEF